jgi:hypothetical protein
MGASMRIVHISLFAIPVLLFGSCSTTPETRVIQVEVVLESAAKTNQQAVDWATVLIERASSKPTDLYSADEAAREACACSPEELLLQLEFNLETLNTGFPDPRLRLEGEVAPEDVEWITAAVAALRQYERPRMTPEARVLTPSVPQNPLSSAFGGLVQFQRDAALVEAAGQLVENNAYKKWLK